MSLARIVRYVVISIAGRLELSGSQKKRKKTDPKEIKSTYRCSYSFTIIYLVYQVVLPVGELRDVIF
jgi:hypothetical protein